MIKTETKTRVRYAETDKMGIVYNANYGIYYEIGRTEMFRQLGLPYSEMEANNIIMPVVDLHCNFHKSAHYDELLTIETVVDEMPTVRLRFKHRIFNEQGDLLTDGYTTLVFMDAVRNRPTRIPDYIKKIIEPYF